MLRRTPLTGGGFMARGKPLAPRSQKRAREMRDKRVPLVAALLAERPWCEVRWDEGCQGRAVDVDEVLSRGRGGDYLDEANCQTACRHCHDMKTRHPAEAEARGLSRKTSRP